MTDLELISTFKITQRTAQNWRRFGPPKYAENGIAFYNGTHPDWLGFKIRPGAIITPANESVSKFDLELHSWLRINLNRETLRCIALENRLNNHSKLSCSANDSSSLIKLEKLLK